MFVATWLALIVSIMVIVVIHMLSMEKTEVKTAKILNKLELTISLRKISKRCWVFLIKNHKKNLNQVK